MVWVVIGLAILGLLLDSDGGKFVLGAGVVALGFLFIKWISGMEIFLTLAKISGIALIVVLVFIIIASITDC